MSSKFRITIANRFDSFQSDDENDASIKKSVKTKNKLKKSKKLTTTNNNNIDVNNVVNIKSMNDEKIDKIIMNSIEKIDEIANMSDQIKNVDQSINWFDLCEEDQNDNIESITVSHDIVDKEITANKLNIVSIEKELIESNELLDGSDNIDLVDNDFMVARRKKSNQPTMQQTKGNIVHRPVPLEKVASIARCQQNRQRKSKQNNKKNINEKSGGNNKKNSDINGNWRLKSNQSLPTICNQLRDTKLC